MTKPNYSLNEADLRQFTGTVQWRRHSLARDITFTDGVKYVADEGGAYWLLDRIALANMFNHVVQKEEFQVWKLKVALDNSAVLACEDGNGNKVHSEKIDFTDFPLPEVKLWFSNKTILLPSEW
jgi:hypothetical protein